MEPACCGISDDDDVLLFAQNYGGITFLEI